MDRKSPRVDTLKLLYALSGNQCAFPECEHPIFNDSGLYIANLCHIEAASENGPRFNREQSEDDRKGINNLLFMCHRHHKETDDTDKFTVDSLRQLKQHHESNFSEAGRSATREMLNQIKAEIHYFWTSLSSKKFEVPDLKIERDFNQSLIALFDELDTRINNLREYTNIMAESDSDLVLSRDLNTLFEKLKIDSKKIQQIHYYENPFVGRNWELHNLGRPNHFSHLNLCILQLKVKVFEALVKVHPGDVEIKGKFELAKEQFEASYNQSYYVD